MRRPVGLARAIIMSAIALTLALSGSGTSWAQGCILIRQSAPLFGTSENFLAEPGEISFSMSYRTSHADDHYNGTAYQSQRKEVGSYVVNNQQAYDFYASYAVTRRASISMSVPFIEASWSVPTPFATTGPRAEQNGEGIGDLTVSAGYWLLNPGRHQTGNLFLSGGIKAPTGDYNQTDNYPDLITGANNTSKVVDQSVQPGDGGWGFVVGIQGFKQVSKMSFYGAGSYLVNPRDTNGAPSVVVGLGFAGNPALASVLVNTVADSYLLRTGATFHLKGGLSASLGFRMEGVPRYDLIGDSHGFRRPGYETYAEPGLIYRTGRSAFSIHVPLAIVRNRQPNPYSGDPGDATFPDHLVLASYSHQFGPFARLTHTKGIGS
ncbi:MAG TPA: hypothetical protein VFE84_08980 [Patescibacteria group bacterium]|nr:hypothetical protein [Patescibacteria group bacterium]